MPLCYSVIMNQYEYEEYLKTAPQHPDYEPIGRRYKDCFGIEQTIILHKNYWAYLDWLVENADLDAEAWIAECDKHREDKALSYNLMHWLWWDECDRHRKGHATPSDIPPLGYEE